MLCEDRLHIACPGWAPSKHISEPDRDTRGDPEHCRAEGWDTAPTARGPPAHKPCQGPSQLLPAPSPVIPAPDTVVEPFAVMVKPSNAFVAGPAMFGFLAPGRKHLGEAACQQPVQGKKRVRGPSANGGETGSNSPSQRHAVSKSPLPHAARV